MPADPRSTGIRDNHYCGSVGDFLKPHIRDGSRMSVVSAYFTIYAYAALKEWLDRIAHNPLQPYFLVYVLDDGNARLTFAQPKQVLGIYRELCVGKTAAYEDLCTLFDQQTADGANTTLYDTLLQKAVESIVSTFRKRVVTGLQTGRSFKIPDQKDQASDTSDFELVTWLVIKSSS
jgi:hypothetical protein